jgi:hypothetical protein
MRIEHALLILLLCMTAYPQSTTGATPLALTAPQALTAPAAMTTPMALTTPLAVTAPMALTAPMAATGPMAMTTSIAMPGGCGLLTAKPASSPVVLDSAEQELYKKLRKISPDRRAEAK